MTHLHALHPDPVRAADRYGDSIGTVEAAYLQLHREFLSAALADPRRAIQTPGFSKTRTPVANVISEEFSGKDGEELLNEFCRVIADAARGVDCRNKAMGLLCSIADTHARFHCDDLIEQESV